MDLSTFQSQISSIINMGAEVDPYLPSAVRQAVRWIERNYTLRYMKRIEGIPLGIGLDRLDLGSNVKAVYSVDVLDVSSGKILSHLTRDDYSNIPKITDTGLAKFFDYLPIAGPGNVIPGNDPLYLLFDRPSDKAYNLGLTVVRYSDPWSVMPTSTHWLIDNAEDLLTARSIFYLAPFIRDADLMAGYKIIGEEAINTLLTAEIESVETPTRQNQVGFGGSNG